MSAQDVLVVAEIQRDALADVTGELLATTRELASATGGEVLALVLSQDGARYAGSLGAADRIILVDDPQLAGYSPEPHLAALQEVIAAEQPRAVLVGATSIGWDLAPLLSARLDVPLVTGCKAVRADGADLHVTVSFCGGKLVAVGRGIQQKDNLELAEELAQALGGVVCASRPVIDQGWLPATRQVGKSGMTVKPRCFLALGISGAPEHVEGMKGSELIIAVNTDPKAPIFDVAHYGAVADLMDLVPALIEALKP